MLDKSKRLSGHRDEDIELYWHLREVQNRAKDTPRRQGMVDLETKAENICSQATAATDAAWEQAEDVSTKERIGSIRDNRDEELQVRNSQEALSLETSPITDSNEEDEPENADEELVNEQDCMMTIILQNRV